MEPRICDKSAKFINSAQSNDMLTLESALQVLMIKVHEYPSRSSLSV